MTKPCQHLLSAFGARPFRKSGARDYDHGKPKLARGVDLGARAGAAGIARDQELDATRAHQLAVAFDREGAARDDDVGTEQGRRAIGRIDEAQGIGVLRPGGEGRNMLAADGEEDARALFGQSSNGRIDVGNLDPVIAVGTTPWCTLQREQRRACRGAGLDGMPAHLDSERVRRIGHMRDALSLDEVRQSLNVAKAADPRRQRMGKWNLRASGVGIDRVDAFAQERVREPVGVSRSAQDEGAHV